MRIALILLALLAALPASAQCAGVDQLSTYAVLLGRGAACKASIDGPSRRVGAWIDRTWNGQEKSAMTMAFMIGMENAAKLQANGKSPDSCDKVREVILTTQWP